MIDPQKPDYTNTPVSPKRPQYHYFPVNLSAAPCVSIITPFYNTREVFYETAHSVLNQSFQQWEWLIINDGSTDARALAILEAFRNRDPRIRVIDHPTNLGLSAARNTGFREARTGYVVQLDSDDLLEPTAIEKWFWFLESYPEYAFVKGYSVGFGAQEYLWQKGFHQGADFLRENLADPTGMIRRRVHLAVDGYDETIRAGLEDWDFWLRCANAGYWGATIPEYLDWYRRTPDHSLRWSNWDGAERQRMFLEGLRKKYPKLWEGGFPSIRPRWHMPNDPVPDTLPAENRLCKNKPRLLMMIPWMTMGGADKFNLDLVQQLTQRGWEITIATTLRGDHSWMPEFARYTPDIFALSHFLRLTDYPRFLRYLIGSRQPDVVLISNSELGYLLLPYLRAHFPEVAFVDFCHMEEEYWKNGGYPRMAVEYQEMLDLNIVSSEHLKSWMARRGAESERIRVCYTNICVEDWPPDAGQRTAVRREFGCSDETPIILYAARICEQKQPLVFARTMLRLRQSGLEFLALVAGDGPDLEKLRSFINRHQLRNWVWLLGRVPNTRVKQLMQAANIFFLPSAWEGIALSFYEAMACGLPIVGADVGGQRELVTPECGVLIPRSDAEAEVEQYAQVLADLIRDPERRAAMGRAGRARVEAHFRLEQMGMRMVALFEEARQLCAEQPRPTVSIAVGRICAAQAVEYTRLFGVADWLWAEREQRKQEASAALPVPIQLPRRARLYFALTQRLRPWYQAMLARDMQWAITIKNILKKVLLGHPE